MVEHAVLRGLHVRTHSAPSRRSADLPSPSVPFQTLDGAATAFADFRGQVLLVNFWATWCVPCVQEMPALERLHLALADGGLAVLAISQDRGGEAVVDPFLARLDLQHRSEEHTSELQSLMRISYAVFCLKKKNTNEIK